MREHDDPLALTSRGAQLLPQPRQLLRPEPAVVRHPAAARPGEATEPVAARHVVGVVLAQRLQRALATRVALGPPEGRLLVRAEHEDAVARSWHKGVEGLRTVEARGEAVALEVVQLVVADQVEHGRAQPAQLAHRSLEGYLRLAQRCVPPIRQVAELRHRDDVECVPPVNRPTQLNECASERPSHGACIVVSVVDVCELHVCNEPEREQRPLRRRWSARGHALRVPVAHGTDAEDGSSKPSQPAAVWRSLLHIPSREPTVSTFPASRLRSLRARSRCANLASLRV